MIAELLPIGTERSNKQFLHKTKTKTLNLRNTGHLKTRGGEDYN